MGRTRQAAEELVPFWLPKRSGVEPWSVLSVAKPKHGIAIASPHFESSNEGREDVLAGVTHHPFARYHA